MSQSAEHGQDESADASFTEDDAAETEDEGTDVMSRQSFPTSDPPSGWAGADEPQP